MPWWYYYYYYYYYNYWYSIYGIIVFHGLNQEVSNRFTQVV